MVVFVTLIYLRQLGGSQVAQALTWLIIPELRVPRIVNHAWQRFQSQDQLVTRCEPCATTSVWITWTACVSLVTRCDQPYVTAVWITRPAFVSLVTRCEPCVTSTQTCGFWSQDPSIASNSLWIIRDTCSRGVTRPVYPKCRFDAWHTWYTILLIREFTVIP